MLATKRCMAAAHVVDGVIKAAIAEGQFTLLFLHQVHEAGAVFAGVALRIEGAGAQAFQIDSEIFDTENFRLVHGNSACDLLQVFAAGDFQQELFDFAKFALGGEFRRVGGQGFQRIHIGCKPGKAVGFVLVLVKGRGGKLAIREQQSANGQLGFFKRPPAGVHRLVQCFNHKFRPSLPKNWTLSQVFVQRNIMCRNWAGFLLPIRGIGFFCLLRLCK